MSTCGRRAGSSGGLTKKKKKVCIKALREPDAGNKVVEIVAKADQPPTTLAEAFASVL